MNRGDRWWLPSTDGELPTEPWMHPNAVAQWAQICEPWMTALEFGGGGSTLWLAERVAHVTTHEPDKYWHKKLGERRPDNVTLRKSAEPPKPPPRYSMIAIDGERAYRGAWMDAAPALCMPGGIIVVDNFNRPEYAEEYARLKARAAAVTEIDGNVVMMVIQGVPTYTLHLVTAFLWMPDDPARL